VHEVNELDLDMPAVHYTNLLIVVGVGLLAPLALGFFGRLRLPAIVLELVFGIVIGPSGLGWAKPDLPVSILALIGLAFLLFLSGLEIDVERLRGRILNLITIGFALSIAIAIIIGLGLKAGGFVKSPLFVAIVLAASSVSVIFPVLKDSNNTSSSFGQLVLASASIAEFGAIILLSLFFSGNGSTSTAGTLVLLGAFGLVVVLAGVAIAGVERSISLSRVIRRLQDTTAQIRVRAAFALLIGFTALADQVGLETILGAFAAGVLLSLLDRDEATHPQFRLKLEAAGFGVFIPVFFVTSGLRFDLNALFASASTVARVPLFLLAIYLARGLPAIVYVRLLGRPRAATAGVLQATSLTVIVAAAQIGLQFGAVTPASAAGLVAAGLLSVVISPALGLVLLRREQTKTAGRRQIPNPVTPVTTTEDCTLPHTENAASERAA
jgi:Kef-type K+ transport system membrane component KefB